MKILAPWESTSFPAIPTCVKLADGHVEPGWSLLEKPALVMRTGPDQEFLSTHSRLLVTLSVGVKTRSSPGLLPRSENV